MSEKCEKYTSMTIALRRRLRHQLRATTEGRGPRGDVAEGKERKEWKRGQGSRLRDERSAMQADLHLLGQ